MEGERGQTRKNWLRSGRTFRILEISIRSLGINNNSQRGQGAWEQRYNLRKSHCFIFGRTSRRRIGVGKKPERDKEAYLAISQVQSLPRIFRIELSSQ